MDASELVRALLEPATYPGAPPVELRETHISWVFLAGELAYKVKKPLVLPFLDYGTPARRLEMCREEVRLNRRLAPRIYLRVVGIAPRDGGYAFTADDDPGAVEYAVVMRRVDERHSLASLARAGELEPELIAATAALLARFHAEAAEPPRRDEVAVLEATLDENLMTLRESGRGILDEDRLNAMEHFTRVFLAARRDEIAARASAGRVRDCHGDLRAEHVIVPEEGEIYVYDCVEFNADLRWIDVAADLAFLVMDLTAQGAGQAAWRLVDEYRAAGGDPGDDTLLAFFAAYRAWVRAKVDCVRAAEVDAQDAEHERMREEAEAMMRLGHRFAWRARGPLVLALCGPSGSGKTTIAEALAELSGWERLSSDVTRKRLAGISPTEPGGAELYTAERKLETYRELGHAAAERMEAGDGGVIVDATFHLRSERDAFREALAPSATAFVFVECHADRDLLEARVRERGAAADRVSDADERVLAAQLAEFEPLDELPSEQRIELDTDAPPEALAARVERLIDAGAL